MAKLSGFQKKYLRGLAHRLKPVVFIGQKGLAASVISAIEDALGTHELIKIRFLDVKERDQKALAAADIEAACNCDVVGKAGHIIIVYRQHSDPEKRKIVVPDRKG